MSAVMVKVRQGWAGRQLSHCGNFTIEMSIIGAGGDLMQVSLSRIEQPCLVFMNLDDLCRLIAYVHFEWPRSALHLPAK
jgi:hypothetical protein